VFSDHEYFPILNVKPAEIGALEHLPGTDKDRLLPIIGLKKWYNSSSLDNSIDKIHRCFGQRRIALDLGLIGKGTGADEELTALRDSADGYSNWVSFLGDHAQFTPTVQLEDPRPEILRRQIRELLRLDRGIVFRLRRTAQWGDALIQTISQMNLDGAEALIVLDIGQIQVNTDLTALAVAAGAIAERSLAACATATNTICVAGSSFPSEFASINRQTARIDIRERRLQGILNQDAERRNLRYRFAYGDYGSVFAGDRGFAQSGNALRVDYPARLRWVYHRSELANAATVAAQGIMNEPEWDDGLAIWGTTEIRRAADGDVAGLEYQRNWTAVRIHLHLHRQLNFEDGAQFLGTDEPWQD
jgi:hypothetical protein